jgi:hypothetical protein
MIPSSSWFPRSLQERAAWYENFNLQVQTSGATLGLTISDVTQIGEDNAMMQFLATAAVTLEAYNEAVTQFRNIITAGDIGDTPPPFPADPTFSAPVIPPVGIFERVSNVYRTRIMASAAYTDEQGALYGIIGSTPVPPDPAGVKPQLKTFPAAIGNMFSCVVTGREQADQCQVSAAEAGTNSWIVLGTFTGKSGDMTYPNTTEKPVQLQVRVQLRKSNANYGQPSDIVLTTVNP